jgi:PAS domain S-box-containing protein
VPIDRWKIEPTYRDLFDAIDNMNCGFSVVDLDGNIAFVNRRVLEWCGYKPQDVESKPSTILLPEELHEAARAERQAVLDGDLRVRIGALRRRDGRTFPTILIPMVLRSEEDEVVGLFNILVDVGEVQTAKRIARSGGNVATSLERIADELHAISLTADASQTVMPIDHPELRDLSAREQEVLAQLLAGRRVPAIAAQLFISPHTVRAHLKAIYRKVGVSTQSELIERVRKLSGAR